MEFRQLQTFMMIAQTESFSKAADILGYSQSAVTVQIRPLEKELATRLFEGEMEWDTRFRLIPYSSIGVENGLLRGFVADELIVFEGRYFFQTSYPVLAVAKQPFGKTDGYEIILHPNMV